MLISAYLFLHVVLSFIGSKWFNYMYHYGIHDSTDVCLCHHLIIYIQLVRIFLLHYPCYI